MKWTNYQDRAIAYRSEGRGKPVVLLHGFCEDSYVWDDFKQDLLEEGYQTVCIDLPGFGRSALGEPSIDYYAAAVLAVLDDLHLDRVTLVGHSMGGYTALAVAELAPERLLGLGLLHSHPYADTPDKVADRQRSQDFIERMGHPLFVKQLIPKLFAPHFAASNPFLVDKLIFRANRFGQAGILHGLTAMAERPDRAALLTELGCPVLFINGLLDEAIPVEARQQQLALPERAHIHTYARVGHMAMFEARRASQLAVRQFVDYCYDYA